MRYILLIGGAEADPSSGPGLRTDDGAAARAWWAEHAGAGRILDGHRLAPTHAATTISRRAGRVVLSDGPLGATTDAIHAYAVIDVPDLDAAISLVRSSPLLDGAAVEIRPVSASERP